MSEINITYPLECHIDHSKQTLQTMLNALRDKYAIQHEFVTETECRLSGSGVTGNLLIKDDGIEEIEKCISAVLSGEIYYSSSLESGIKTSIDLQLKKIQRLTPSERTIIRLIAQDKTSAAIGIQLSMSVRTVEKHRSNIISKLDANNGTDSLKQWTIEYKDLLALL